MSKQQTGRGSGLSGLIDLPGFSAKFNANIIRVKTRATGTTRQRRGRGGGVFRTVRWMMSSGNGAATATLNHAEAAWPAPDAWKGQTGNVTFKVATGKTIVYPIMVSEAGIDFAGEDDEPKLYLAWELTGAPTYNGWSGTQPAATDPSKADQEQWGGQKVLDPKGLHSRSQTIIDLWGTLADTDAAEETKLTNMLAAQATPMSGMKKRSASFVRDALDGGRIVINWGLTDTEEDALAPVTRKVVDPDGRDDFASTAAFNATPPAPEDTTLAGLSTDYVEFNDNMVRRSKRWSRVSPVQAIKHAGTHTGADPDSFSYTAQIRDYRGNATVSAPSPPAGLQYVGADIRPDRDANGTFAGKWIHDYFYGPTTRKQAIEQEGFFEVDVGAMADQDVQTLTASSSSAPADPGTRVSGLQIVRRRAIKVQNTPEKWKFYYYFGRLTSEESIEHAGTSASADVSGTIPVSGTLSHETLVDTCSSGTAADALLGTAVTALHSASKPWLRTHIRKRHKTRFEQITEYPTDDKSFVWGSPRSGYERRALDATGAFLRVPISKTYGSGQKRIYIAHWEHFVTRQVVQLTRYFKDDHIADISFDGYVGTRCSDSGGFLGKPQYTISFIGPAGRGNWLDNGSNRWYRMVYLFEYCAGRDSLGNTVDMNWVDSAIPRDQWYVTTASITVPGTPAASTVDSTFVVQTKVNASYTSFLA